MASMTGSIKGRFINKLLIRQYKAPLGQHQDGIEINPHSQNVGIAFVTPIHRIYQRCGTYFS